MTQSTPEKSIAYYISAHGYGHGVRSCDIIRAVNRAGPSSPVWIITDLPESFLRNRLPGDCNRFRRGAYDVGMAQLDSIRVNVPESLRRIERLHSKRDDLITNEVKFLRENHVGLVVVDIPALPLQAAALAGLPGLAVGHFGWDWIYSEFIEHDKRWEPIVKSIQEGYEAARLLLRLPFAEEMRAFRRKVDLPVVASPGRSRRSEIAALTGADPTKRWILISFTTLEWSEETVTRVEGLDGFEFFTVLPMEWRRLNIHPIDREDVAFGDIVASVDAVLSKPGFGIVSDCAVNDKPLIYAERRDFREYAVIEAAIGRFLRHRHIPAERLYRGELEEALHDLESLPPAIEAVPRGGDEIAAKIILDALKSSP